MAGLINTNYAIKEADTPQSIQINKVNMKGVRPQFRGISDDDTFEYSDENKNKKKTALIVILSVLVAAGGGVGFLAHKGGKTLGKEAKFGEKIEQGWKELFGKSKDIKNNKPDNNRPNNNNPADNNKPPKSNGETPNETKPNDTKVPDNKPTETQTPDEQLKIEDKPKTETPAVTQNDGQELSGTTVEEILAKNESFAMFQQQTKEEVLGMFNKEEQVIAADLMGRFEAGGVDLTFAKLDGENMVTACPKEEAFDTFVKQFETFNIEGLDLKELKQEIKEEFIYEFKWKNYDEFINGLKEADGHISKADITLNTKLNCSTFTEEQVEEIVNDRMKFLTELGLLSKFRKDFDGSTLYEITPTEATKSLIKDLIESIFGTVIPDNELNKIVKMYEDVQQFNDFEGYKRCEKYYRERLTEKSVDNAKEGLENLQKLLDELKETNPDLTAEDLIDTFKELFTGENLEAFIKKLMGGSMLP